MHTVKKCLTGFIMLSLVGGALVSTEKPAHADTDTIKAQLMFAALAAKAKYPGLEATYADLDRLDQGGVAQYKGTCYTNMNYIRVAVGEHEGQDIDIYVYDENGNEVARDQDNSSTAIVEHSPKWSGQFTTKVRMYGGSGLYGYASLSAPL
jgi:hypothetical protein